MGIKFGVKPISKMLVVTSLLSLVGLAVTFNNLSIETSAAEDLSSQKELGKYWMQVSASTSTKSNESHSIDVSFTTGYSSFSTDRQTTVKSGVTKGGQITYSKDIDAADTADFDAFYYDGKDGAKAFSKLTTEELDELANSYRANYSSACPSVYDALIQNITAKDDKNSICIIPRFIYSSDVGKDPYVSDTSSWSISQKGTPIFETVYGDKIYCHDDVIFFGFNPEKISAKALEEKGASTFQEIFIPRNVKTIYANSFFHDEVKPLGSCIFRLEATKEEIDDPYNGYHYESGCFGSNPVSYGYENFSDYYDKDIDPSNEDTYKATKSQRSSIRTTASPAFGTGKEYDYNIDDENMKGKNDYFIGYYPQDVSKQKPLIAKFDVVGKNGSELNEPKTLTYTLPAPNGASYYAVGNEIYKLKNTISFDILFENLLLDDGSLFDSKKMEIDPASISIYNIYHAVLDEHNLYIPHEDPTMENPEYCGPLYCKSAKKGGNLRISFDDTLTFDSFLAIDFEGLTAFSGFSSINLNFKKTDKDIYKKMNPSVYKTYEEKINRGEAHIRYRIDSLKQAYLGIKLKDGAAFNVPIDTPVKQFSLDKDENHLSLLLNNANVGNNFSTNTVAQVDIIGFYISLDIASNTNGPIGRTALTTRFGAVNVMPYSEKAPTFNGDIFMIIFMCSYTAFFAIVSVALYFFLKNKFKNDEFRRVKTKKYVKNAILTFVCVGIVILEILSIAFRATLFNNAIVVFNPIDAYIIAFGVLSILIVGYFIKFAVVQGKAIKARRMAKRLKLDEDVAQDGTN